MIHTILANFSLNFAGLPPLYNINTYRSDLGLSRALDLGMLPEEGNLHKPYWIRPKKRMLKHFNAFSTRA